MKISDFFSFMLIVQGKHYVLYAFAAIVVQRLVRFMELLMIFDTLITISHWWLFKVTFLAVFHQSEVHDHTVVE